MRRRNSAFRTAYVLCKVFLHAYKIRKQRLPRYKEGWNSLDVLPRAYRKVVLKYMRKRETAKLQAWSFILTVCYLLIVLFMLIPPDAEIRFYGTVFMVGITIFSIPFWIFFFYQYFKVGKGGIVFQEGVVEEIFEENNDYPFADEYHTYQGETTLVVNGVQGHFLIFPQNYDYGTKGVPRCNDWLLGQPAYVFKPKHLPSTTSHKIVLISTLMEQI